MRRNNLEFLFNRTFWASVCLVRYIKSLKYFQAIVFAFMSGQMWNHIRGPPFVMTHPQTRETSFVHGSTQYQLIAETYIVLALYAGVTTGMIILNDAASSKTDPSKRKCKKIINFKLINLQLWHALELGWLSFSSACFSPFSAANTMDTRTISCLVRGFNLNRATVMINECLSSLFKCL